jgi:hypothetical protein
VKEHHYSHSVPGGVEYSFRLEFNGQLGGALLIGMKTGNVDAVLIKGHKPTDFRELVRLVLLDAVPRNSESQFISWCVRYMKQHTQVKALVSFADPEHGHSGTVYRASGWRYDGVQEGRVTDKVIVNGEEVHPRTVVSRYGTASRKALINIAYRLGHKIEFQPRITKHRYVYDLRTTPPLRRPTRRGDGNPRAA